MTFKSDSLQNRSSWSDVDTLIVQMKEFLKESEIRSQTNKREANRIRQELVETRRKLALLL